MRAVQRGEVPSRAVVNTAVLRAQHLTGGLGHAPLAPHRENTHPQQDQQDHHAATGPLGVRRPDEECIGKIQEALSLPPSITLSPSLLQAEWLLVIFGYPQK